MARLPDGWIITVESNSKGTEAQITGCRELVRCKDCKHIGDMYKCPVFYSKEKQPDNWFCADGKRRANDAE